MHHAIESVGPRQIGEARRSVAAQTRIGSLEESIEIRGDEPPAAIGPACQIQQSAVMRQVRPSRNAKRLGHFGFDLS
jgi:hypothetical protein